jgi:hypothetical protein
MIISLKWPPQTLNLLQTPQHKAHATTTQGPGFTLLPATVKVPAVSNPHLLVPSKSPIQALSSLQQRLNTPPPPPHMLRALSETVPNSLPSPQSSHAIPEIITSPKGTSPHTPQTLEARPTTAPTPSLPAADSLQQGEAMPPNCRNAYLL